MSNPNNDGQVAAATLKLPVFWPADPELWFAQVEAQFATRNITSDNTKFNHLIGTLSPETAAEVRDLLITPPEADKYKHLKEEIIKRTTNSEASRLKQLLTTVELEGRKPSQLLRHMRQLAGLNTGLVSDDLMKQLFIQRLPNSMQIILTANDSLTLDKLADLGDKLMTVATPQIHAVDTGLDVSDLRKEIAELKSLIRGRSKDRSQAGGTRNRSKTPAARSDDPDLCWYHAKYADKAKKCRSPCKFVAKSGNDKSSH